jgi:protein-tyrosine phosphatase
MEVDVVVARTSASHPLRVDWLPVPWPGRIGLTFAPGKKQLKPASGIQWDRELAADVRRLGSEFETHHLVCLLEDKELHELDIAGLGKAAQQGGIAFHRLRVPDGGVPPDPVAFARLVSEVCGWSAAGDNVVIHCKGGLGRAGTFGGCVLRVAGLDGDEALAALNQARGPSCPETLAQEAFIRAFSGGNPSPRSAILGAVLGAAIGDAMGHPTEFLSLAGIQQTYGPTGLMALNSGGSATANGLHPTPTTLRWPRSSRGGCNPVGQAVRSMPGRPSGVGPIKCDRDLHLPRPAARPSRGFLRGYSPDRIPAGARADCVQPGAHRLLGHSIDAEQ